MGGLSFFVNEQKGGKEKPQAIRRTPVVSLECIGQTKIRTYLPLNWSQVQLRE